MLVHNLIVQLIVTKSALIIYLIGLGLVLVKLTYELGM